MTIQNFTITSPPYNQISSDSFVTGGQGKTFNACKWCGLIHYYSEGTCPSIKAIEYYPDGSVKRVEFHAPADSGYFIHGGGANAKDDV